MASIDRYGLYDCVCLNKMAVDALSKEGDWVLYKDHKDVVDDLESQLFDANLKIESLEEQVFNLDYQMREAE